MSYDYLGLVNDINDRLNEVRLTSADFATAIGYYADAKNAVNQSLLRINIEEFEWPFNHQEVTLPLVVDQVKYNYEADVKSVAFDTFRIKGDTALNNKTTKLKVLDYEEFLEKYGDTEYNPEDYADVPTHVFRGRDLKFGLYPPPDQIYELHYEYYRMPVDLVDFDDVPTVPEQFRFVILEGALYHAYLFRGGLEEAAASNELFKKGLKDMRKIYTNRTEYVRSTVIRS